MTYVNKRSRAFQDRSSIRPLRRRSEGRLRTYPSSEDLRTWCDTVEERRQHIIELVTKDIEKCSGKLVPLDFMMRSLTGPAIKDLNQLKKCMKDLWNFIDSINMSSGDKNRLNDLKSRMHAICVEHAPKECIAKARHDREKAEIEDLIGKRTTRVKTKLRDFPGAEATGKGPGRMTTTVKGPARITTRIKGLQPGTMVLNKSSKEPGNISIKAQGPARVGAKAKEAYVTIDTASDPEPTAIRTKRSAQTTPDHSQDEPDKHISDEMLAQLTNLQDQLAAREILCKEQEASMKKLSQQKDNLQRKLEDCLAELENFKKLNASNSQILTGSCKDEIDALEAEIKIMRSGNLSPEQEADLIGKELEVLKKYCLKLKTVGDENEKLKLERDSLKSQLTVSVADVKSNTDASQSMAELKDKLKALDDMTKERDTLANKVHQLETQLKQYQDLPGDIDDLKTRSNMLDNVLEERDNMSKQLNRIKELEKEVADLQQKANRVDELERELKTVDKIDRGAGAELKKSISRCSNLELELQNMKQERDAMNKRIEVMKKDSSGFKSQSKEVEMLKLERDRLQIRLNELADIQMQYDDMMTKMKMYDRIVHERDMYKQKYEQVLHMECQCEMLRAQVDAARDVMRERDHLKKQVCDLETCIYTQEEEIKKHVQQIENLSQSAQDKNSHFRDTMSRMSQEMQTKNHIIAASEEKLEAVQAHLKSSIQGVSVETACLKARIEELEKLLGKSEAAVIEKDCVIKCLEDKLNERGDSVGLAKQLNRNQGESVETMRQELEAAKAENKKLQEIAKKMISLTGDEHVKKMLKQSECAVRRVVEELGRQYREWDHMRQKNQRRKMCTKSNRKPGCDASDMSGSDENLRVELEEIQREKQKLEALVKSIQDDAMSTEGPQKELMVLRSEKANLEKQLEQEIQLRMSLEEKINSLM